MGVEGVDEVGWVDVAMQSGVEATARCIADALAQLEVAKTFGEAQEEGEGGTIDVTFFEVEIL